ncbi:hypothetical protein AMECASPLE_020450 [Ameca splendens]|uniref:Secreted protein n=1 Tax=Ameca splendens TaxID=208324 RepID=A0ABV0YQR1_9TELE
MQERRGLQPPLLLLVVLLPILLLVEEEEEERDGGRGSTEDNGRAASVQNPVCLGLPLLMCLWELIATAAMTVRRPSSCSSLLPPSLSLLPSPPSPCLSLTSSCFD